MTQNDALRLPCMTLNDAMHPGCIRHAAAPSSLHWLLSRSRLQLGAEAMALQGADLVDLPACLLGGPLTDRQLQNLFGWSFHVWQFVAWFTATMEALHPVLSGVHGRAQRASGVHHG